MEAIIGLQALHYMRSAYEEFFPPYPFIQNVLSFYFAILESSPDRLKFELFAEGLNFNYRNGIVLNGLVRLKAYSSATYNPYLP